jgi:hypothetical protein
MSRRSGATPWLARTQLAYARALRARGDAGDAEHADALLTEAQPLADSLGMAWVGDQVRQARRETAASAGTAATTASRAIFRREGDFWNIAYDGRDCRLKDSKGLRYLAELLRCPGREIHVVDLAAAVDGDPAARRASPAEIADAGLRVQRRATGAPLPDAAARASYRRELEQLRDQLEVAQELNDGDRAAQIQLRIDAVAGELAVGMGLQRRRAAAGAADVIRQNVSRALKTAIGHISRANAPLGIYLAATIKKGIFCSYAPGRAPVVRWEM